MQLNWTQNNHVRFKINTFIFLTFTSWTTTCKEWLSANFKTKTSHLPKWNAVFLLWKIKSNQSHSIHVQIVCQCFQMPLLMCVHWWTGKGGCAWASLFSHPRRAVNLSLHISYCVYDTGYRYSPTYNYRLHDQLQ